MSQLGQMELVQLELKEYQGDGNSPFTFFTTYNPDHMME